MIADLELGARPTATGTRFRLWAPAVREAAVEIGDRRFALERGARDMFELTVPGIGAGTDYRYVLDGGRARPDPVSRWQPAGPHGPSRVVDPGAFAWRDTSWRGIALADYLIYELHVGTFTPAGTFASAIPKLRHLVELGITAVELMPVAEFPGNRNWGYDGVHMFAPQSTYGGPDGLRTLIDACHAEGLAVILDVVYNHVGPEGNYLGDYAPYFTDRYSTPWGRAINLDGPHSDGVRRHLVTNALMWFREYHVDALRLDAIHGIFDSSPRHLLEDLQATVQASVSGRQIHVIAESDLNDVRVIRPVPLGYGLDAQWSDDFHHALRTVLTRDPRGYFADFGTVGQLAKAITDSFVFDGQYSEHRQKSHGTPAAGDPGERFVVCVQNHDQIANGSQGRRLTSIAGHHAHALAATLLLTAPNLPLLFMGEEFAERAPFHYFISHGDPALVAAVRDGRRRELADLAARGELLDPQAETTFDACKLDWSLVDVPAHAEMLALYRALIALRREEPALHNCRKDLTCAWSSERDKWLVIERGDSSGRSAIIACNLDTVENRVPIARRGSYRLALATREPAAEDRLEIAGDPLVVVLPPHAARIYLATHGATR